MAVPHVQGEQSRGLKVVPFCRAFSQLLEDWLGAVGKSPMFYVVIYTPRSGGGSTSKSKLLCFFTLDFACFALCSTERNYRAEP